MYHTQLAKMSFDEIFDLTAGWGAFLFLLTYTYVTRGRLISFRRHAERPCHVALATCCTTSYRIIDYNIQHVIYVYHHRI